MSKPIFLVTGGCGYIGSHIVLALRDASYGVVVVDDLSTGCREAIDSSVPFVRGDIRDEGVLRGLFGAYSVRGVVHAAAVASVPESVAEPQRCQSINVAGTKSLLEAMRACDVGMLIFSSTSGVYDEGARPPFDEGTALGPLNPYAQTKVDGEQLIESYGVQGLSYAILRYFNVGGADPQLRAGDRKRSATTLIKSALECALGKRSGLAIFGTDFATKDGTGIRDYVHVWDIARAHVLALEHLLAGGRSDIFNLGVGRGFSVREVIKVVKEVTGVDFAVREEGRRQGDPPCIYGDVSKARQVLGYRAAYPRLESIVRDSWRWEQFINGLGGAD
ncbi:MAG: UDP-glucose 4-epimerase GalE [Alphaproteobacteria bacterium GM202ARS2]|nr:UDP-glucose 4-epimerase GalE [Alphaproteobacteria bacterium GM202ARS2]